MARKETIDSQIERLIGQLGDADDTESERIHNRIFELEQLKKKQHTT